MTVTWNWAGALTSSGFRVVAKVTGTSTRLAVSTSPSLTSPTYFGPVTPASGIATLDATGLAANTQYYWAVEDGTLATSLSGQAKTFGAAGSPYTVNFAAIGDAGDIPMFPGSSGLYPGRVSNSPAFAEVTNLNPLPQFLLHLGDLTYYWLSFNHPAQDTTYATYASQYDDVMLCSNQNALYRKVPIGAYMYDNHELAPGNATDRLWPGLDNMAQAYRDRVPHHPLTENGTSGNKALYHSFVVGRVLFMITDNYYHADPVGYPAPRAKLGTAQLAWMSNLLSTTPAQFLVWVNTIPSNDPARSVPTREWGWYQEELATVYGILTSTGFAPRRMIEITADKHRLAWGSTPAGYPIYMTCPIDAEDGGGGGFTQSLYPSTYHGGAYGKFRIEDLGYMFRVTTDLAYYSG